MHKLAVAFTLLATPALATGLQIEVAGEGANGTIVIDPLEDMAPLHVAQITALAEEGAYDGILLRGDIVDRAITKEINSSKELRDTPGVKLEQFSDGAMSKASKDKATQDLQTLEQRIADDPNLANQRLHYATWDDLKQDYVTTEKSLGDVIAETKANRNVIDLLKNCKL